MNAKEKTISIGGQAVIEGVMMRGASSMALAVRDPSGEIQLETYRINARRWYNRVPLIRGMASFVSSLVIGMKMLTRSAEISSSEEESIGKGGMTLAVIIGLLIAVGLFIVLPEFLAGLVKDHLLGGFESGTRVLLYSLTGGIIRIFIFILYLVFCASLKDIKRTFMYHGAEHKTINCFESGKELTVENIQKCSTVHRRCGTTFLFIVMVVSILIFAACNWVFEMTGFYESVIGDNKVLQKISTMLIKLAFLPIVAGVAYEVLKLTAKLPYNLLTKVLLAPGLLLQKLTTKQPDDGMVEVALKSFLAVVEMDKKPMLEETKFFEHRSLDVIRETIDELLKIGAEEVEAYWIMSDVLKVSRSELSENRILTAEQYKKIKDIIARRKLGEPLDYIFGYSIFYGYKILVNSDVLIPRMETETLCECAINEIGDRDCRVLDLCTGSGCIALVLLNKTAARVTASDISEHALKVASKNLEGKECNIVLSDLFVNIDEKKYDIIVSNPPYIKSGELANLQKEVIGQPKLALDGGKDGLYYYRDIIRLAPGYLCANGVLLLEIGHDQAEQVTALLQRDFINISVHKDLSGSDRVIRAELKEYRLLISR